MRTYSGLQWAYEVERQGPSPSRLSFVRILSSMLCLWYKTVHSEQCGQRGHIACEAAAFVCLVHHGIATSTMVIASQPRLWVQESVSTDGRVCYEAYEGRTRQSTRTAHYQYKSIGAKSGRDTREKLAMIKANRFPALDQLKAVSL